MMLADAIPMLPHVEIDLPGIGWFSPWGCVQQHHGRVEVFVGGSLIASFEERDRATRNATLVGLAADPHVHLGRLAEAFEVSIETLRLLRKLHAAEGIEAVMRRAPGGRESIVSPALRRRIEGLFDQQLSVSEVHRRVRRGRKISRSTVLRVRKAWKARQQATSAPTTAEATDPKPTQKALALGTDEAQPPAPIASATPGEDAPLAGGEPQSGAFVQHAGTWLLLATVARLGLHARIDALAESEHLDPGELRLCIDSVVAALSIGEPSVEGVRRLETPSAPILLRADHAPSASWIRRVLHEFADTGAALRLHLGMAGKLLREAKAQTDEAVVFYVDNHLRPYTGKHVVRKGWRMQAKRALPGTTDYYVHDERGRPVLRVDVPSHDSLPQHLFEIADLLRVGLGDETRILLGFDRAGAFPETMAALRDRHLEFVTYERKPFPELLASAFDQRIELDGEAYGISDSRINLGAGRGRVRRIAIRTPAERQVNLLASSDASAERLVSVMFNRWRQENAFKHGVERWGANHLDGRRVVAYPPDTIVPNPARRRLDHALHLACVREGLALRELGRLDGDDPRRDRWQRQLAEAIAEQKELFALRPSVPHRAKLSETELAGELVHHLAAYKTLLDTVRIACANAEADLAYCLAPELPKPAEAKKTLANLLAAPGRIRVGASAIDVSLAPAATSSEREAFGVLLDEVNHRALTLPGDPARRRLRFEVQS